MNTSRYIVITLIKICVVILLIFAMLVIGAMIGYGVIGKGQATDVFKPELWKHIFEFME